MRWLCMAVISTVLVPRSSDGQVQQIMFTYNRHTCRTPHYYDKESMYTIRALGALPGRKCNLTFIESEWSAGVSDQHCLSLCVTLKNSSMRSCDFRIVYHDGLQDQNPKVFTCHNFPPSLWCSSKKNIVIEFKELNKYKGEGYEITLDVKPYCDLLTTSKFTGDSYRDRYYREEKRQRDTVIIAGSLVSTISFLFVIFWIVYCCWKRQSPAYSSYTTQPSSQMHNTQVKSVTIGPVTRGPQTSSHMTPSNTNDKDWYPMATRNHACSSPGISVNQPFDHLADSRYTDMPGSSSASAFTPQRGITPGFHLRQFSQGEPYNPLAPIREQVRPYFKPAKEDSVSQTVLHKPPPLPPRPNMGQMPPKQYYV